MAIIIDNSKDASVGGSWSNPGAKLYDDIMGNPNWKELLKETYLVAPTDKITTGDGERTTGTSFSASGVGYPHHVIRGGKLVLHRTGLRASFSRGKQQGIVGGAVEAHLKRHYHEMGWYEESSISEDHDMDIDHSDSVKMAVESIKDELMHFGILGMKWGVRRERGSGGRVTKSIKSVDREAKDRMRRAVKERRMLTDAELAQKIARIEKEKRLRELTDSEINTGKKITADIMKNVGSKVATTVITGATLYAIKAALTGKFSAADLASYVIPKPGKKG